MGGAGRRGGGGGCAAKGRGDGAVEACSLDKMKKFLLRKGLGYFFTYMQNAEGKNNWTASRIPDSRLFFFMYMILYIEKHALVSNKVVSFLQ
jgi:hypothetical protein